MSKGRNKNVFGGMIMFTLSNPGVMDFMLRKLQQKVSEVVVSAHGLFFMLTNLWSPV